MKNCIMPMLLALSISTNSSAEEIHSRDAADHNFGTPPGKIYYPESAVNTDDIPSVALAAETGKDELLKTYEIIPDTYFIYGNIAEVDENNRGFNGNAGFVVTDNGVVVIDSLGSPRLGQSIINTVKSVTGQPIKYLILTHNHPDHAYGASAFKKLDGVTVIGHEGILDYINSERIDSSVTYRNTFIRQDMTGFKPVTPDLMIGGEPYSSNSIKVGGKTFDIYNTGQHHSFGDLVVHQRDDQIVWISDLAFNNRVTFMADGHSQQAVDAQTWLLEKFGDSSFMIPGHGSVQTPPFPMITRTRDYMQRLRGDMTKAVENGVDLQTAVDNTEYKDWQTVQMYDLNHRKNVDFVYREMELEHF